MSKPSAAHAKLVAICQKIVAENALINAQKRIEALAEKREKDTIWGERHKAAEAEAKERTLAKIRERHAQE